jgi:hypothetical protein
MKTEGWVLIGVIGLFTVGLFIMAMIGLPTKYGTAGSAFPPTINGQ